ncbi:PBSX family phage terminase large subunit, partial [Streptococcus agalactiae]
RREDWFISVLHGAVRSGKTYLNNFIFLMEIKRVSEIAAKKGVKNPMYILAGYSMSSIQDNVLTELSNVFGLTLKFDRYNSFE